MLTQTSSAQLLSIALDELRAHPDNPRLDLREDVVEQLTGQMSDGGFGSEHAILVRPLKDVYQIISGHHRVEAARKCGMSEVPCWVRDMDDDEAFMQLALSNAQGELSPLEIGIHALKAVPPAQGKAGAGIAAYAKAIGRSDEGVRQLRAAAEVLQLTKSFGKLEVRSKPTHLYEISKAPRETWPALVPALVKRGWSVDETASMVRTIKEFDIPDEHTDWMPADAVIARFLEEPRFDAGKVTKIIAAADGAAEWIELNATDDDAQEFRNWLVRQQQEAWDAKKIDGWLVGLIRRVRERQLTPEIREGDFREVLADLPDGSVDLILTDPPYGEEAMPNYEWLSDFAAKKLKPGGSLLCYTGQSMLPEVLNALGGHLRYWWVCSLDHSHGGQQLPGKWVMVEWKPLVWYVNGHREGNTYIADKLRGSRPEKGEHEWAQGIEEVFTLIESLTGPDDLVVDPFAGSGSFGKAALALGRRFIGADLDPESDTGTVVV
jgi:ParB-like chromosome segregation protein Spo0J